MTSPAIVGELVNYSKKRVITRGPSLITRH
jgi:hypothetical protein